MGRRISFPVAEGKLERNHLLETIDYVDLHIGVGTFVDGQSCRGMGIVKTADTSRDSRHMNLILHLGGYIDEVHMLCCGYCKIAAVHIRSCLHKKSCVSMATAGSLQLYRKHAAWAENLFQAACQITDC